MSCERELWIHVEWIMNYVLWLYFIILFVQILPVPICFLFAIHNPD